MTNSSAAPGVHFDQQMFLKTGSKKEGLSPKNEG